MVKTKKSNNSVPLPEKLRPKKLSEFVGQKHLVGKEGIVRKLLLAQRSSKGGVGFPSIIFWGPPGSGKTTLARIIANELKREFYEFSAVNTSTKEIQKVTRSIGHPESFDSAQDKLVEGSLFDKISPRASLGRNNKKVTLKGGSFKGAPIIFIDEIHRFNKAQQDKLLPHVEKGEIIFIGATTENPSFEVIGPLMSRCRVLVLNQLDEKELGKIIDGAIKDLKIKIDRKAKKFLIGSSNGDARVLLNVLEIASNVSLSQSRLHRAINHPTGDRHSHLYLLRLKVSDIEQALQRRQLTYDDKGEEYYNVISAFIKSMRASNVDAALYYLARMVEAGQDPLYIARRMVVFASEDIGMAQPTALVVANEVFRACETIGYPECQENLAHGVVYLATAKKDRSAYNAYMEALSDVKKFGNLPVPMNLRNAPTKLMKNLGYGESYDMYDEGPLLPDKIKSRKYYKKVKKE